MMTSSRPFHHQIQQSQGINEMKQWQKTLKIHITDDIFLFIELQEQYRPDVHISDNKITVLGTLPPRKIAPSPNFNANPKPNPDPDRGVIFNSNMLLIYGLVVTFVEVSEIKQ